MPLESLLKLVETLRSRIDEHGAALRQSEAQTRYALIDPLLRELGWDTGDPRLVIPEYKTEAGSADYALFSGGKILMMVEAKNLGTPPRQAVNQVISYCIEGGIDYFAVTNGNEWEIYETHRRGDIDEKRVVHFDLKRSSMDACIEVLKLWRQGAQDEYNSAGWDCVFGSIRQLSEKLKPATIRAITPTTAGYVSPLQTSQEFSNDLTGWILLSELKPQAGSGVRPSGIMFPDNSQAIIRTWKDVPTETVRWLIDANFLNENHCPILRSSRGTRYIINNNPIHRNGRSFEEPRQVDLIFLETFFDGRELVNNTRIIIEHVGLDSAQFKVRLPQA